MASPNEGTRRLSVLVPVKDEEQSLELLAKEITAALDDAVAQGGTIDAWEVILVDDGSVDGSWNEIERLADRDKRFRGLRFRRNLGKSAALAAALETAEGSLVAMMDADLQDDPAELPGMLSRLNEGADLVAGHKAKRRDPMSKRVPSKVFNFVTSFVTGLKLRDHNCGLKVGRREAFESVPLYGEMHRFLAAIAHANGFRVVEQSVNHRPRMHGRSKFGLERYARGALDLLTVITLTRFSKRPAHLFGGIGLLMGTIGLGILVYLSSLWLFTDQSIGGRPLLLMGVLFVLVGVQLMSVGLLAELLVYRDASGKDVLRSVAEEVNSTRRVTR